MVLAWVGSLAVAQVVELPEGEILSSLRLRAMGGAIVPIAESTAAFPYNPAAVAVRQPFKDRDPVEVDLGLQVRDHPLLAWGLGVLGFPEQRAPYRRSYAQVTAALKVGRPAVGLHWRENSWQLEADRVGSYMGSVPLGWGAGEWAVGLMPHLLAFQALGRGTAYGGGATAGALWAPDGLPLRFGAMGRTPMRARGVDGPGITGARVPAQCGLGASASIGAENVATGLGPDLDRGEGGPIVLLAADAVLTGGSGEAVALLGGRTSGPTVAVHAGGEAWLAHDVLRARLGMGTVPSRGDGPWNAFVSAGGAVRVWESPQGVDWRLTALGELFLDGPAIGVGIESW